MIALDPINWRTQLAKDDTEYRWSGAFAERPTLNRAFRPGTVHDFSRAQLTCGLKASGRINATLQDLTIALVWTGDRKALAGGGTKGLYLVGASDLTIRRAHVIWASWAVYVDGGARLTLEEIETEPRAVANGVSLGGVSDAVVRRCRLNDLLTDGVHVAGCARLRISDNDILGRIPDFSGHGDGVQLDGYSEDVWITDNRISGARQGVFGNANNTAKAQTPAVRVLVTGNDICVSQARALSAPDGVTWTEAGNRISTAPGAAEQARMWGRFTSLGGTTVAAYANAAGRSWAAA